ncbi:type II toxin-antitoxin system RnlB family antitoxin [Flavobacterium sp. ov086]|uniref:type II toxin-antitoxin system RnlB family antitoxin n=1 Tax=Flavobacterium sp. ov086 TaxID=1761785 RepID=UPI000B6AF9E9|nr:type II toxin-antitoxin system RnlB family antitoxin [Flavobacterium sp. ov086]SNR71864.1 Antitoxin to toxin RNase LS or RnlA [Flavobacterium sp. ov086]
MFVQSVNYNNPINQLNEISKELVYFNFEGKVVFDLLLTNGNSSGRFLISSFTNSKFEMSSFRKTVVAKNIRNEIIIYYKKNQEYLSNSILSKKTIQSILNENV